MLKLTLFRKLGLLTSVNFSFLNQIITNENIQAAETSSSDINLLILIVQLIYTPAQLL